MGLKVGIVGASGAVGQKMIEVLGERISNIDELCLFASEKSQGKIIEFRDKEVKIQRLTKDAMEEEYSYLLFSAGGEVSSQYAPIARDAGNIVIDNSSFWRMKDGIPLVVPEVNSSILKGYRGIIANPNCSTIQMLVAIAPLHRKYTIRRIVVSTYQSVSGSGYKGLSELRNQAQSEDKTPQLYSRTILGNCIPHIDSFEDSGFTKEEIKMVNETRKILDDQEIEVNATTVRVPVEFGHSESIYLEFGKEVDVDEIRLLLQSSPGIRVMDDPSRLYYPTPLEIANTDLTYVGRIRRDLFNPRALSMWVVADNLRKGAATNAVQIIEAIERIKQEEEV